MDELLIKAIYLLTESDHSLLIVDSCTYLYRVDF